MKASNQADEGLSREVKIVALVVVLGVIMSVLDTTIVNVALDTLSRDLHAPLGTIQWVSTGYLLSLAMVIPLAGWLSERSHTSPGPCDACRRSVPARSFRPA
ncbi:MAG: MFS transporter [Solirubrobacteraceae bacterium]